MALSRVKTWIADEVLTASNLNAEFNNILNNALSLISPITGTLDLNANKLVLDADADTSITSSQDDRIDFEIAGTDSIFFGHATGNTAAFVTIDPLAFSSTATVDIARLKVASTNALTVPAGVTALAAGLHVAEPNFTATGTITSAATVYIAAAPSEGGTNNYAFWVDAGATQLDGAVVMASTLNVTGAVDITGTLTVASNIIHQGDANNLIGFGTDTQSFETGGTARINLSDTGLQVGTGARVTTILDEDDLVSDSATALATQQSIKAYADALSPGPAQASQAAIEAETNENTYIPPDLLKNSPGVCKVWASVDRSAGTPSLDSPSYNMTSVTDDGAANTIITIATDFSGTTYAPGAQTTLGAAANIADVHSFAAGALDVHIYSHAGADADTGSFFCWAFGDQ